MCEQQNKPKYSVFYKRNAWQTKITNKARPYLISGLSDCQHIVCCNQYLWKILNCLQIIYPGFEDAASYVKVFTGELDLNNLFSLPIVNLPIIAFSYSLLQYVINNGNLLPLFLTVCESILII